MKSYVLISNINKSGHPDRGSSRKPELIRPADQKFTCGLYISEAAKDETSLNPHTINTKSKLGILASYLMHFALTSTVSQIDCKIQAHFDQSDMAREDLAPNTNLSSHISSRIVSSNERIIGQPPSTQ